MRLIHATWLVLAAGLAGHIEASSAQDLKTFESWVAEATEPEVRQRICEQAYHLYFAPVFEKEAGREVPPELSGLWRECGELLAPSNAVVQQLVSARENFNRAFAGTARWSFVLYVGRISNPAEAVSAMINTAVGLSSADGSDTQTLRLARLSRDSIPDRDGLAQSLQSNVQTGDFLLEVRLRDRQGETYKTLNSISPDGHRYSGYLFLTVRLPATVNDPVELPNTKCRQAMTQNIFGIPFDHFDGCVRAACDTRRVKSCLVTKSECTPGPVGDCKILPAANTTGDVDQPDCHTAFSYAWSAGLRGITISAGKFKFNGSMGQSGEGSFLVEESCVVAPTATLSETFASDVLFDVDRDELKLEGQQELDHKLANSLAKLQIISVIVDGHTDGTGPETYNLDLSRRRANRVKEYLVGRGVASNLIEVHGYGLAKPIASNATREGRAKNRRVEIIIKAQRL
jgi:outer membrane protein OmpA-like peptidoglycan-associated protein